MDTRILFARVLIFHFFYFVVGSTLLCEGAQKDSRVYPGLGLVL